MKKGLVFFLGIITGVLLTFIGLAFLGASKTVENDPGISLFEEPGDVINVRSFKVFQVLNNGTALAKDNDSLYDNTVTVLLWNDASYYDDMVVKLPSGKKFRQIGIYRYNTRMNVGKTIPIVKIMD